MAQKQTGIVTKQIKEKETQVTDKHDDNSECGEDVVKEKDVGKLVVVIIWLFKTKARDTRAK